MANDVPFVDKLLENGAGRVYHSEYTQKELMDSLLELMANIRKENRQYLEQSQHYLTSANIYNDSTKDTLAFVLEEERTKLSDIINRVENEATCCLSKNNSESQLVISEIFTKAYKLEIEKRAIKEILFFTSSFQRFESVLMVLLKDAFPKFDWKKVYLCIQESAPLQEVVQSFKKSIENLKIPFVAQLNSVIEGYLQTTTRIISKIKDEIQLLFTFQGYLKSTANPKKDSPGNSSKNPFHSNDNPFLQLEDPSKIYFSSSELLSTFTCICDLIGTKSIFLEVYLDSQFREYFKIFSQDQEISSISHMTTRLEWLMRRCQIIKSDHLSFFPKDWNPDREFILHGLSLISKWMLRSLAKKSVDSILELALELKRRIHIFEEEIIKIVEIPLPTIISELLEPYLSLILHDQKKSFLVVNCSRGLIIVAEGSREDKNGPSPITFKGDVIEKVFSSCLQLMDSCRASLDTFIPLSTGKSLFELSQVISEVFSIYLSRFIVIHPPSMSECQNIQIIEWAKHMIYISNTAKFISHSLYQLQERLINSKYSDEKFKSEISYSYLIEMYNKLSSDSIEILATLWKFPLGTYVKNIGKKGTTSAQSVDPLFSAVPSSSQSLDISKIRTWISSIIKPLSKSFTNHNAYERFYTLLFTSLNLTIEEKLWNARFPSLAPTFLERLLMDLDSIQAIAVNSIPNSSLTDELSSVFKIPQSLVSVLLIPPSVAPTEFVDVYKRIYPVKSQSISHLVKLLELKKVPPPDHKLYIQRWFS